MAFRPAALRVRLGFGVVRGVVRVPGGQADAPLKDLGPQSSGAVGVSWGRDYRDAAQRARRRIGGSFRLSLKLSAQSPPTGGWATLVTNAQNQPAGFSYTISWRGSVAARFFQPCLGLVEALEGPSIPLGATNFSL